MTNRSAAEKAAREIALHFKDEGVSCNEGWILLMADIIERACGQDDAPVIRCWKCNGTLVWKRTDEGFIVTRDSCGESPCGETAWVSREGELDELQYAIEAVLIRRHLERTLEGHTLDTAKELAKVVRPLPSPPTGRTEEK